MQKEPKICTRGYVNLAQFFRKLGDRPLNCILSIGAKSQLNQLNANLVSESGDLVKIGKKLKIGKLLPGGSNRFLNSLPGLG